MIGGVSDDLLAADQEDESLNTYKATLLGRLLYPSTSTLPVLLKLLLIAPPPPLPLSHFYTVSLLKYRTRSYRIFIIYSILHTELHVFVSLIVRKNNAAHKINCTFVPWYIMRIRKVRYSLDVLHGGGGGLRINELQVLLGNMKCLQFLVIKICGSRYAWT
jgi:hypothetical protein